MSLPTAPAKPGKTDTLDLDSADTATAPASVDLKSLNIGQLAKRIKELQNTIKDLKDKTTAMNSELEYIQMHVLPEKMEEQGLTSTVVQGIGRISVRGDMFCNVPADNRQKLESWLEEHGYGDLIKPTVNASSLKAMVKELSESQDEDEVQRWVEIQDIVSIRPFMKATLTKN